MITINTEAELKGCLFELEISGSFSSGGSNRYGSDEPEWADTTIDEIVAPDGRKLSPRLEHALMSKYENVWTEQLIERAV